MLDTSEPLVADPDSQPRRRSRVWEQLRGERVALVGAVVTAVLILAGVAAPVLARLEGQNPYTYRLNLLDDSNGNGPRGALGGVSWQHWFGVEPLTGRDLFAISIYGLRTSLLVGIVTAVISVLLGLAIGLLAAYFGGLVDSVLSRFMDVMFAFPGLIFMIALTALVPADFPRMLVVIGVISIFGWTALARVVRGQARSLMQREFILAARTMGAGWRWIILREVLPNLFSTVLVFASLSIPAAVGTEAALSFLGVGIPPPSPDLGRSISDAIPWVQTDPMFLLFPAGLLFLAVLGFNLFGDGLRDALDPRAPKLAWSPTRRSGR